MKNKMFYIDKNETIEDILKQIKEFFEYDSGIVCDDEKLAYFKEDTFNQLLDYITNLQEEVEYKELWRKEYLERIDKAIEYIKSLCYIENKNEWFTYGDDLSPEHIVNILNGDEE